MGSPLFLVMTAALLAGAIVPALWPSGAGARRLSMIAAFIGSLAAIGAAWPVLMTGVPWTLHYPGLLAPFGGVSLTLDRLGAFFLALIGFTGAPAAVFGLGYMAHADRSPRGRIVHALINLFLLGMGLVPAAGNVVTLLFGWELMAVASYLLVVGDLTQEDGPSAGLWYGVMTHAGFLALMAALMILVQDGSSEFAALRERAAALGPAARTWVFALALFACGSKAGLLPVHVWLPRAHPAAPSHASALMSAAMVKLGLYAFIRVTFDLLPPGPAWWGGVVLTIGVATALAGVLYAVAELHIKRVLAYSTIENIGVIFVALGFALLMRGYGYNELAAMGLVVCLLHALNHAVFKSLLFLAAGAVVHGVHSAALEDFGGLIRRMPQTAVFCLIGVLGLAALPPLNGFPSEWLVFQLLIAGARHTAPELAIVLPLALAGVALSAGLAAVAGVRLFGMTFLALPRSEAADRTVEAAPFMRWAMVVPATACLALGLAPTAVLPTLGGLAGDLGLPVQPMGAGLSLSLPMVGSRLWPIAVLLVLAAGALLVFIAMRARRRAGTIRVQGIWNCGRVGQSALSEYTAASFAEPLKRVFTGFYRPTDEVTTLSHPVSPYFVQSVAYRTAVAPWIEQALYSPVTRLARWASRHVGRIQAGSIHVYLAYLPGALLLILLLSQWIGR
jgi:formate hydrogenlyase subunit 3/multisubunit Na+/H+ antiporter MnhD subunit